MPALLFRLNGVSGEEANEVRALLDENNVEYYETTVGRWGISLAAIWLPDEEDEQAARDLLQQYQSERSAEWQARMEMLQQQGFFTGLWLNFLNNPLKFVMALAAVAFVLGFTIYPFLPDF